MTSPRESRANRPSRKRHLTIRAVTRDAIALYRQEPGPVALTALVTFIPVDLLTVVLHGWSARLAEIGHTGLSLGAEAASFFLVTAGQVFLAGVLDHLEAAKHANEPFPGVIAAYRRLPFVRLLLADILASAIAAVASLAFVITGIVTFALFGIVGPVINIEDRTVLDALSRSASLVAPHLWLASVVVAIPLAVEVGIEDWFLAIAVSIPLLLAPILGAGLSLTVRPFISLLEVILGERLILESRSASSPPSR